MKRKIIVIIFFTCLVFCSYSYAEESICFDESTASRMIVHIEKVSNLEEQIELYKEGNKELEYQVRLLKEVNGLRKEQVDQLQNLVKLQKDSYEAIIKESKPSFIRNLFNTIGAMGIGVLIGLCL